MDCRPPIHNLPPEILSSIFMLCCEKNTLFIPSNQPPVMMVSAVCGRWRGVVLATPVLWSKLEIVVRLRVNGRFISYLTQTTQLFMQRSKNAPLTWSLECYRNGSEFFLPMFKHLMDNCERWSDVSLFVDGDILEDPIFESVSGHIPILKRLELQGDDFPMDWNAFAAAPALSVLDCVPLDSCDIILPWVQIKDLTLHLSYSHYSLTVLSRCPNLEQLELECIGGEEGFPDVITIAVPITLRQIRSLSIISEAETPVEDSFGFVLEYLTLPCLSSVTLGSSNGWKSGSWDERQQQIQQFLLRSRCNIIHLSLEVLELDGQQTIDLLMLFPSLEILNIHDKEGVIPLFLQQFIIKDCYSSDSPPFLPRLSNLTLVMYGVDLDAECLCNAIVSRWNPVAETGICGLRSVTITAVGDVDGSCLEKLSSLEKLGTPGRRITISFIPSET